MRIRLSYADGIIHNEEVLKSNAEVTIADRALLVEFVVFPNVNDNYTLLAIDF